MAGFYAILSRRAFGTSAAVNGAMHHYLEQTVARSTRVVFAVIVSVMFFHLAQVTDPKFNRSLESFGATYELHNWYIGLGWVAGLFVIGFAIQGRSNTASKSEKTDRSLAQPPTTATSALGVHSS